MSSDEPESEASDEEPKLRVFLSYSRKDKDFITKLADALTARGYLADFDQSLHRAETGDVGIAPTDDWWIRLQDMIAAADVMVLSVSPDSAGSKVVDEEIAYARSLSKRVIAITCREVDFNAAPPRLSALNVSSWFIEKSFGDALSQLCLALDRDVDWLRSAASYTVAAKAWDSAQRAFDRLLIGEEIGIAESWSARRPATAPEISELVLAFLSASRSGQTERDLREKRTIRRTRNLQRWIGVAVAAAFVITLAGAWFVIAGQRNLGRSTSIMLAQAARQASDSDDHLHAVQLSMLASRDWFLAPAVPDAGTELAYNAAVLRLQVDLRGHEGPIRGATFSPDEMTILTWSYDGTARIWNAVTGTEIGPPLQHAQAVVTAAFSGDGHRVLTASADGLVRVWNAAIGKQIGPPISHKTRMRGARYLGEESRILTWGDDVKSWDATTGSLIGPASPASGQTFNGAEFSADTTRMTTWDSRVVWQWDVATGRQIGPPMQPPYSYEDRVHGAIYSRDGSRILSYGLGMSGARQWDAQTGKEIWSTGEFGVEGATFSHDETRVLTWTHDGSAQQWDATKAKQIGLPMTHGARIAGAIYSDFDEEILTWSDDGTAKLWTSAETERSPPVTFKHKGAVSGALFQIIGNRILTWSEDGTARLWEAQTGEQVGIPLEHEGPIVGAVFSSTGDKILTWGKDGIARIWKPEPEESTERKALNIGAAQAVASQVCQTKLLGVSVPVFNETTDEHGKTTRTQTFDPNGRPVLRGVRRIDKIDIEKAPILNGRDGEDVCDWSLPWYDEILRTTLGWAFP